MDAMLVARVFALGGADMGYRNALFSNRKYGHFYNGIMTEVVVS